MPKREELETTELDDAALDRAWDAVAAEDAPPAPAAPDPGPPLSREETIRRNKALAGGE